MPGQGNELRAAVTDRQTSWIERRPDQWRDYATLARWDRPIGTWLLLLPCWWSTALAAHGEVRWELFVLFGIGALSMRGAGCVINDLWDRDIDAKVARTSDRPLASGAIGVPAALLYLGLLLLIGLAVLVQLNWPAIVTGFAIVAVIVLYPLAKRVTFWPQFVLGIAFNWGALVGWAAVRGTIEVPALLLYAAGILWTLGYDTIYALQDIRDDAIAGVRSTARLFGEHVRAAVGLMYALSVALSALAVHLAGVSALAYAGVAAFAAHCAWQVATIDPQDRDRALALFRANRNAGLLLFAGYLAAAFAG